MKPIQLLVVCIPVALAPAMMAQRWEFGGGVGGGFYTSQDVTNGSTSAAAKIATNIAGSAFLDNNSASRWGGELRYDYQMGALQLSQGSTQATFAAHSQAMHYDVIWHATPRDSKIRPFLAAGAGVKIYQGTGGEVVYQALSTYALLTKAQDLTPLVSAGGGVKIQIAPRIQLRAEIHDYLTPFPKKVITPNLNSKAGGWLQDFVPSIGIAYTSAEGR